MESDGNKPEIEFTGEIFITNLDSKFENSILNIESALTSLASTTSNGVTSSDVLSWVLPAFFGALSAYFFNFLHWKIVEKKQRLTDTSKTLSTIIKDLDHIAVEYWLQDYDNTNESYNHYVEISIRSNIVLIVKYITNLSSELKGKRAIHLKGKLESFRDEIFELVTGDDFETKSRLKSKTKATQISKKCSNVRALLSTLDY